MYVGVISNPELRKDNIWLKTTEKSMEERI